jgi:hypothetical protein
MQEFSNVNNVSYDSSSTSDILQVTTTGEGLKFHYYMHMEFDASDTFLLSCMSDDDSKNGRVNQLPKDIPIPKTRIVGIQVQFYMLLLHQNLQGTPQP